MDGASWLGDIAQKYLSHAHKLESYIAENRSDPRWIFYCGQSYHDSASMKDNLDQNRERLRRSIKYYKERTEINGGYHEEIFYSQYRIGAIMTILEEPWYLTQQELLKAYSIDPLRGESIKVIIDYYLRMGEWNLAYLYSKFAVENFHGKSPYPTRLLFVEEPLYQWKFLETHAATAFYAGKTDEAKKTFKELLNIVKTKPQYFSPDDILKIENNKQILS